jgi:hypothetical protein
MNDDERGFEDMNNKIVALRSIDDENIKSILRDMVHPRSYGVHRVKVNQSLRDEVHSIAGTTRLTAADQSRVYEMLMALLDEKGITDSERRSAIILEAVYVFGEGVDPEMALQAQMKRKLINEFGVLPADFEVFASKSKPIADVLNELTMEKAFLAGAGKFASVNAPSKPSNKSMMQLGMKEFQHFVDYYNEVLSADRKPIETFIPAAGAASRVRPCVYPRRHRGYSSSRG